MLKVQVRQVGNHGCPIVPVRGFPGPGQARHKERDWMEVSTILDQFTYSLRVHCAERLPRLLHGHRQLFRLHLMPSG